MAIQANLLQVETELIRGGLESAEAMRFVDAMPTVEQLMPVVDVGALDAGPQKRAREEDRLPDWYRRREGGSWEPPVHAGGELLAPSTASTREARRQATLTALAANPQASNREIARTAGVDHKTVGKLRGESPANSPADGESG